MPGISGQLLCMFSGEEKMMGSHFHSTKKMISILLVMILVCIIFQVTENDIPSDVSGSFTIGSDPHNSSMTIEFEDPIYNVNASQYSLPIQELPYIYTPLGVLNETQKEYLKEHGHVNLGQSLNYELSYLFEVFYERNYPTYITTDVVLHIYHILFDSLLSKVEEIYLYNDLKNLTTSLISQFYTMYNNLNGTMLFDHIYETNSSYGQERYRIIERIDLKEAARLNLAYMSVALMLLDPNASVHSCVSQVVSEEIELIDQRSGYDFSPIFDKPGILTYKEDYSQYKPRGHYTRSVTLERFFKAMMWLGRMTFRTKSGQETVQAILLTDALYKARHNGRSAFTIWKGIYDPISFFIGDPDDLIPPDYSSISLSVYGLFSSNYSVLLNSTKLITYMNLVDLMRKPRICSNLVFHDVEDMVNATLGMRLLGQRFTMDAYAFQELVFPRVMDYYGNKTPFTLSSIPNFGLQKGFPRGLEAMAMLGSGIAEDYLVDGGDTEYLNYSSQFSKVKGEFQTITNQTWGSSVYYGWLHTLNSLSGNFSSQSYPTFMRNRGFQAQKLNTMLGSWTALKHDTILHVKQPTTGTGLGGHHAKGYVEPIPDLYSRLEQLTNFTRSGLNSLGIMPMDLDDNLGEFISVLDHLEDISKMELDNISVPEIDHKFIRQFYWYIGKVLQGIPKERWDSRIIADVHTDPNTGKCLEEATGYFDYMLVIYSDTEGSLQYAFGPIFSYYEFKQPMSNRLTDEDWRQILVDGIAVPEKFDWMVLPEHQGGIDPDYQYSEVGVLSEDITLSLDKNNYNGTVQLRIPLKNFGEVNVTVDIDLYDEYENNRSLVANANKTIPAGRMITVDFDWNVIRSKERERTLMVEISTGPSYDINPNNNIGLKYYDLGFIEDLDWDGALDKNDAFPIDPSASVDTDQDGYPDEWNHGMNESHSTTGLFLDMFPNDPLEWMDTDGDGVGDNSDMFPEDPLEWSDLDGDGFGDNADEFPDDPLEWMDTDGDGVGDNSDMFPNNSTEWNDTDLDGFGDNSDAFPEDPKEWKDSDGDGYGDNSDEFPQDPSEWIDTDLDGHGDNKDAFPYYSWEWDDSDGDGIGDNSDIFPLDPNEWVDNDGDGYGDNGDVFPFDPLEWSDLDGDGFGDNSDLFPEDPLEWADSDRDGYGNNCDAFPDNVREWKDSDDDWHGDNTDAFPNDPSEWMDTDRDGVGDNSDAFPLDPAASVDSDGDGYPDSWNQGMSEEDSVTGLKLDDYPNDPNRSIRSELVSYRSLPLLVLGGILIVLILLGLWMNAIKKNRNEIYSEE